MELIDVIRKLNGPITPTGMHEVDMERLENLKNLCGIVRELVTEIDDVYWKNEKATEKSVRELADYADDFVTNNLGIPKD